MIAGTGLPLNLSHFAAGALADRSRRGAVAGAVRLQAACGEPDELGVYRDLDGGVAGVVVVPAGAAAEHVGQGLIPGAFPNEDEKMGPYLSWRPGSLAG